MSKKERKFPNGAFCPFVEKDSKIPLDHLYYDALRGLLRVSEARLIAVQFVEDCLHSGGTDLQECRASKGVLREMRQILLLHLLEIMS